MCVQRDIRYKVFGCKLSMFRPQTSMEKLFLLGIMALAIQCRLVFIRCAGSRPFFLVDMLGRRLYTYIRRRLN